MATVQSNEADIKILKKQLSDLLGNSVQPKDGTQSFTFTNDTLIPVQNPGESVTFIRRADFITGVLGSLRKLEDADAIGQLVIGRDDDLFDGNWFLGTISFYPPTDNAHIDEIWIFNTF